MREVLQTILPVAVWLAIGVVSRRYGVISRTGVEALKTVVVNITLPAVLLNAFATTHYSLMDVVIPLLLYAVCVLAFFMGRLGKRLLKLPSRFVPYLTTGFEAGMLGYALFGMLYGQDRMAEFARVDLGQVLFVFTLYKALLGKDGRKKTGAKALFREMALSPIILSILAGVLLGATGLYDGMKAQGWNGVFDACVQFVSAPTSALILLAVGYDLVLRDIPWRETGKTVAFRLGIMLILRLGLGGVLGILWPSLDLSAALNVLFILPPPFVLPVFADEPGERVYVSSVLSVSTLAAMLGFAVLAVR